MKETVLPILHSVMNNPDYNLDPVTSAWCQREETVCTQKQTRQQSKKEKAQQTAQRKKEFHEK